MKYCKLDEKYFSFRCKFFNAPQTTDSFLYFLFSSLTHTHTHIHVVHFSFSLFLSFSCVFICMFYIFFWYCLYQVACQPSKLRHIAMIISFFSLFLSISVPSVIIFLHAYCLWYFSRIPRIQFFSFFCCSPPCLF